MEIEVYDSDNEENKEQWNILKGMFFLIESILVELKEALLSRQEEIDEERENNKWKM